MTALAAGAPAALPPIEEHPVNTITSTRPAVDTRPVTSLDAIAGWLRHAMAWLRRRRSEAATRRSLRALDDRALHDLGVSRSEISSMAAEVHGAIAPTRVRAMLRATTGS
jgi:uncharacterized protein YjiS (DUF1127 family)